MVSEAFNAMYEWLPKNLPAYKLVDTSYDGPSPCPSHPTHDRDQYSRLLPHAHCFLRWLTNRDVQMTPRDS